MSRIAYVNGRFLPHNSSAIHIEDRAMQFGDGVYEVIAVIGGKLIDVELHYDRLARSLRELNMEMQIPRVALHLTVQEVVRRNRIGEGICYLQITRGSAPRNHAFPSDPRHSVVVTARRSQPASGRVGRLGVYVITTADLRWQRRDIKSVSLLPNVLAKQNAAETGAFEAWLVDKNGAVTEGSHSNAWIVNRDGTVITHQEDVDILSGVTRRRILEIARTDGMEVVEREFTVGEAKDAQEAFLTSTSSFVVPVTRIDDTVIADGCPGSVTKRLRCLYLEAIKQPSFISV